jgi:hypothetical protein
LQLPYFLALFERIAVSLLVAFVGFFALVFSLLSVVVVCSCLVQFAQIVVIAVSLLITFAGFFAIVFVVITVSLLVAFAGFFDVVFSLLSVVVLCSSSIRFAQIVIIPTYNYPISLPQFGTITISLLVAFAGFFAVVFSGTCLLSVVVVCSSLVQFEQIVVVPCLQLPYFLAALLEEWPSVSLLHLLVSLP